MVYSMLQNLTLKTKLFKTGYQSPADGTVVSIIFIIDYQQEQYTYTIHNTLSLMSLLSVSTNYT